MLFNTGVPVSQYTSIHQSIRKMYVIEDEIWLPVETTSIGNYDFYEAWELGIQQIQRWEGTNGLEIIPTRQTQQVYPPVSLLPTDFLPILPNQNLLVAKIQTIFSKLETVSDLYNLDSLLELLESSPNDPLLLLDIGTAYMARQAFAEAKTYLEKAYGINPGNIHILLNLAYTHIQMGDHDQAESLLERCQQIDPSDPRIYAIYSHLFLDTW